MVRNIYDRSSELYVLEDLTQTKAGVLYSIPPTNVSQVAVNIGDVSERTRVSFEIFGNGVSGNEITLYLAEQATPGADLVVQIETESNGRPSGTLADPNATLSIAPGALTNSLALTTESFAGSFTLTDNVKYHVVLKQASDTVHGTNYYQVGGINTSSTLITMEAANYSGTVWGVSDNSYHFVFTGARLGGIWTNNTSSGINDHLYVGFPLADTTAGNSVRFRKSGQLTFTVAFLSPFQTYEYSEGTFIKDTIATEIIGFATSTTTLELIGPGTGAN
jgi:hypothetical protein